MANPIAPNAGERKKIETTFNARGLTPNSFNGDGFEALDDFAGRKKVERKWGERRNKFVKGASRFIRYRITTRHLKEIQQERKLATNAKTPPINALAKVTKSQRTSLSNQVNTAIRAETAFMWATVLPITLSWSTALQDLEEKLTQVIGKETLPKDYIISRVTEAAQIRINNFIADQFNLNEKDRAKLLLHIVQRYSRE